MIKDFKLFETISKEEIRNNKVKYMREIDFKNKKAGTVHNEVDPLGEEVWEIQDKEEIVLNNIYKISTDKINKHNQKIYDMFVKTEKDHYIWIGEILYWKNGEKMEEEDWEELDRKAIDIMSSFKLPSGMNREEHLNKLKDFILSQKKERLDGKKPDDFVINLIDDKSKYRRANTQEVNKMQKPSDVEIRSLKKQLSYQLFSGNIDDDIEIDVTHFDKLYHLIKENFFLEKTFEEWNLFKTKKEKLKDMAETGKLLPYKGYHILIKFRGSHIFVSYDYEIYDADFNFIKSEGKMSPMSHPIRGIRNKVLIMAIKYIDENIRICKKLSRNISRLSQKGTETPTGYTLT